MVERTGYIPFSLGDVMTGRVPRSAAAGQASPVQAAQNTAVPDEPVDVVAISSVPDSSLSQPPPPETPPVATGPSGRPLVSAASLRQPDSSGERLPTLASNDLSYLDYEDPAPLVLNELRNLGVDASTLRFDRYDDLIRNWGGTYTNRLLRVDAGGGRIQDYSIDLALRSPRVTAVEIIRQMGLPFRT